MLFSRSCLMRRKRGGRRRISVVLICYPIVMFRKNYVLDHAVFHALQSLIWLQETYSVWHDALAPGGCSFPTKCYNASSFQQGQPISTCPYTFNLSDDSWSNLRGPFRKRQSTQPDLVGSAPFPVSYSRRYQRGIVSGNNDSIMEIRYSSRTSWVNFVKNWPSQKPRWLLHANWYCRGNVDGGLMTFEPIWANDVSRKH